MGLLLPKQQRGGVWPEIVGRELSAEVRNVELYPAAGGAITGADRLVREFAPDIVILALSPGAFMRRTVKGRVRERWGPALFAWSFRLERVFVRLTPGDGRGATVRRAGRRLGARLVGTAPAASYDEVASAYRAVRAGLAASEHIDVIVMGGSRFSLAAQVSLAMPLIERFRHEMMAAAGQHHFAWFDTEAPFAGPERESYFLSDGIHRNLRGHARMAQALLPPPC